MTKCWARLYFVLTWNGFSAVRVASEYSWVLAGVDYILSC